MNGVDYTKQLAKDREHYQDAVKKTKDAAEKRITDNENRHELVETKQKDTHINERNKLEKSHQKSLNSLKDATKVAIGDEVSRLNKRHENEVQSFQRDSNAKRQDFDRRLEDIKSSYKKSFDSERDTHKDVQEVNQKRYNSNVTNIKADTEKSLAEYQDKLHGAGADLKQQYKQEREQLVRANEGNLAELRKAEITKQAALKDRLSSDLRSTKEVAQADGEQVRNYAQEKVKANSEAYENRFQKMTGDYQQKHDDIREAQQKENYRHNREQQEKITDLQRVYNKQMRSMELEKKRNNVDSGDLQEVTKKQKGISEQDRLEDRVSKLQVNIKDMQKISQQKAADDQNQFNDDLKEQSAEATVNLEKKSNELIGDKISSVAGEREKGLKQVQNQQNQNKLDRVAFEQQLMLEKNNADARIANVKENFNKSMVSLEEKLKLSLEDVTKVSNEDKAEFIKNTNEKRTKEIFELKRNFGKVMDQTVLGYEQKLSALQRENNNIKIASDQKINDIMDQSEKKIEAQRVLYEDRRVAELKDHQISSDQKQQKLRVDMNSLILNYQQKLDKVQAESDAKLKLLTNDYESKLKDVQVAKGKELNQKDVMSALESQKMKAAYEDEKGRLVATYESQIEAIKKGHENDMANMKNYSKLS